MATVLSFDDRDLQSSGKIKWLKLEDGKPARISFASFPLDSSGDPVLTRFPEVVEENGYFIKGFGYVTETPEIKEYMGGKTSEARYATVVVQWNVGDDEKPKTINDATICVFGFSAKTMQKIQYNNKKWSMMRHDVTLIKNGTDISLSPEGDNLFQWVQQNKPEVFQKLWEGIRQLKSKVAPTRSATLEEVLKKLNPSAVAAESPRHVEETKIPTIRATDAKKASQEIEAKLSNVTNNELPF
jgi:hypothetical protein